MAMQRELREKWLKALRSGRYKQAQQVLKAEKENKKSYCCLGVLCTIDRSLGSWDKDTPTKFVTKDGIELDGDLKGERKNRSINVYTRLGLTKLQHTKLISLNDTEKASFKEIADWIEKNVRTK